MSEKKFRIDDKKRLLPNGVLNLAGLVLKTLDEIAGLESCSGVQEGILSKNSLQDVSQLQVLPDLKRLTCQFNQSSTLKGLDALPRWNI